MKLDTERAIFAKLIAKPVVIISILLVMLSFPFSQLSRSWVMVLESL